MSWVAQLARPEIVALKSYEHASWDPNRIRLHANELPWRGPQDESAAGLNRYPEPQGKALIARMAQVYGVAQETLLLCRGSDEAIDLLVRAFCRAGEDSVIVCPPTFGMYAIAARIQGAQVVSIPLLADAGFALDTKALLERHSPDVKLVFLCSPNNPTGNCLSEAEILKVSDALGTRAIVVVDEAYIEFAERKSLSHHIARRPQLAILRTLSKAHGLAGARLGALIAAPEVILLLRKVLPPYAIPQLILEAVTTLLSTPHMRALSKRVELIRSERARMREALKRLPGVTSILPSDANFLLARFKDAAAALASSAAEGIQVRDARSYPGLGDSLRISIGTAQENDRLLKAWGMRIETSR